MEPNMIHFHREEVKDAPVLSVTAHATDPENTLVFQSWGRPVSLHVSEALDLLDFLSKYRPTIVQLYEKYEQNRRYVLSQEIEQLATLLNYSVQVEGGLIDVISKHISQDGQAASFRSDLDGFAAALKWLKARQSESEA